jgi:flavodoxin I
MASAQKHQSEVSMAKIGLFYGSNEGHTEMVAQQIKTEFDDYEANIVEVFNIVHSTVENVAGWDYLIFGIPTWDNGQLQDDWDIFLPQMDRLDLTDKKVALFGLGDQYLYSVTFLDAVGVLGRKVRERGGELVGYWSDDGYEIADSAALEDGMFMGLAIDQDNEPEKTAERVEAWVLQVVQEFAIFEVELV